MRAWDRGDDAGSSCAGPAISLCRGVRHLHRGVPRGGVAVAHGRGAHSLGLGFAVLSAVRFPRPLVRVRPIAVLDAQRLRRLAADRRPAIAGVLAAASARRAVCAQSNPAPVRRGDVRPALRRRRGRDAVVPRPALACRGGGGRGAGLQPRRLGRLAHPAYRADPEPGLPAARAVDAHARAGTFVVARGRRGGPVRVVHRARPRSGGVDRDLHAGGLCVVALARWAGPPRAPCSEHQAARRWAPWSAHVS